MYESPIGIIATSVDVIAEEIRDEIDGRILGEAIKAARGVHVNVNKEELIKALNYDRGQYQKGYADATAGIIHCKDCKHRDPEDKKCDCGNGIMWQLPRRDDWYCADAERRMPT